MKNIFICLMSSIILILGCLNLSHAGNPQWINYISDKYVRHIKEDGDMLWVNTDEGLIRINKFTKEANIKTRANSDLPEYLYNLAIDNSGNKWFSANYLLVKYVNNQWIYFSQPKNGLPSGYPEWIRDLTIDSEGNIWIMCDDYLAKFIDDNTGANWTIYSIISLNWSAPSAMTFDNDGNIWIAGFGDGIAKFDGNKWTSYNSDNSGLTNDYVEVITVDKFNTLWIGTYYGMIKLKGNTWSLFDGENSGIPDAPIRDIKIDKEGNKWIGTDKGLAKYNESTWWTVYNTLNSGLKDDNVSCILIDYEGNKWIGSIYGGLNEFDDKNWTFCNLSNSALPDGNVSHVIVDKTGAVWITMLNYIDGDFVQHGGGFVSVKDNVWSSYDKNNTGLDNLETYDIQVDADNTKWIALADGLVEYKDDNVFKLYNYKNLEIPYSEILSIAVDSKKNIWLASNGGGLIKFNGKECIAFNTSNSGLVTNAISSVVVDSKDRIWAGCCGGYYSKGGLCLFDGQKWLSFSETDTGIALDCINELRVDKDDNVWIMLNSISGLIKFDGNVWTYYTQGLPDQSVTSISWDTDNNSWIGTESGLAMFNGKDWVLYDAENSGLSSNVITDVAVDKYNNKWITTYGRGVSVFNEKGITFQSANYQITEQDNRFLIYPNPADDVININYINDDNKPVKVEIYDISGKMTLTDIFKKQNKGDCNLQLNIHEIVNGIYILKLIYGDINWSKELIIYR